MLGPDNFVIQTEDNYSSLAHNMSPTVCLEYCLFISGRPKNFEIRATSNSCNFWTTEPFPKFRVSRINNLKNRVGTLSKYRCRRNRSNGSETNRIDYFKHYCRRPQFVSIHSRCGTCKSGRSSVGCKHSCVHGRRRTTYRASHIGMTMTLSL